ncbi:MAG: hypothetical protein QM731_25500 [Chitinophagaceae bacterium]
MLRHIFLSLVALLSWSIGAVAQMSDTSDAITRKMYYYSLQKPSATLFVHFDKTVYTNNETVWFTGYLLKGNNSNEYDALSVALLNNSDSTIAAEEKFVMASGLAFGNMLLPDSLPPGNYSLIAYTNQLVNGAPEDVFVQPVTIKTVTDATFTASIKITDSVRAGFDSTKVLLKAIAKDGRVLTGAEVSYTVGKGKSIVMTGKTKTNTFGEYTITIPASKITGSNNLLQVQVKLLKEIKKLRLQLPITDRRPFVKFYPEGGNIVDNMPCVVGFEVTTAIGEPLPATALLYENDEITDTIQTDSYGMGRFDLTPQPGSKYVIKLLNNTDAADKSYQLPATLPSGPVLSIRNALAGDSVIIRLATMQAGTFQVMLHDYRQVYQVFDVHVRQPVVRDVVFPLAGVPKGLLTVTLLDSLDRPYAERMIFAHYDRRSFVRIATDSQSYGTRQKVQLSLKLTGDTIGSNKAIVSIACVQENRLEAKKMQDIESFFYLKHDLLPMPYRYRPISGERAAVDYLQNVLLVKGWRRYTWQDMMLAEAADTLQLHETLQFTGDVKRWDKKLKKPMAIAVIRDSSLGIANTDSSGAFVLEGDNIVAVQGRKIVLAVNASNRDEYKIAVQDPYQEMNKKLAAEVAATWEEPLVPAQDTRQAMIPNDEKIKTLAVVVVTNKSGFDNSFFGPTKNACGDYVCPYNILNCPNHPFGGKIPVPGHTYRSATGSNIVYVACDETHRENFISVKGIYTHKEFYGSDYSVFNPTDPEYLSTIFWKHAAVITADKETKFSFYTSDIAGRFRIIVQGITNTGVIVGEQVFTVRKPEE